MVLGGGVVSYARGTPVQPASGTGSTRAAGACSTDTRLCSGGVRKGGGVIKARERFYTKRVSIEKTSSNEVYYTNSLILLIKMMLCSKLDC